MEIVKVIEKDLPSILEIENECFKHPYQAKDFLYELNENPFSNFYCLKKDGKIVSYIIYWITFDSATICKIATKKSKRKLGFAGFLLENALNSLKKQDVLFVTLEVRVSNINAIELYKKYGFNKVNIKEKYYEDKEDALYMMRGL